MCLTGHQRGAIRAQGNPSGHYPSLLGYLHHVHRKKLRWDMREETASVTRQSRITAQKPTLQLCPEPVSVALSQILLVAPVLSGQGLYLDNRPPHTDASWRLPISLASRDLLQATYEIFPHSPTLQMVKTSPLLPQFLLSQGCKADDS